MISDTHARTPSEYIRIYRRLASAVRGAGIKVELGPLQIEILCLLHQHDGPVLASHNLLPILAVRLPTLAEALKSLHQKRLMRYIPHPTDQRSKLIQLTALGRERVMRFLRHFETMVDPRLDQFLVSVEGSS